MDYILANDNAVSHGSSSGSAYLLSNRQKKGEILDIKHIAESLCCSIIKWLSIFETCINCRWIKLEMCKDAIIHAASALTHFCIGKVIISSTQTRF
jgi:hypothetical protein